MDIPGTRRAGTGAWAGLFNTHFFVDRTTGICASIYTNSLPFISEEAWKTYRLRDGALRLALTQDSSPPRRASDTASARLLAPSLV